ncbi:hypothetical protein JCM10369A_20530 [Nocardioides pyridinolyticus]
MALDAVLLEGGGHALSSGVSDSHYNVYFRFGLVRGRNHRAPPHGAVGGIVSASGADDQPTAPSI